MNKFIGHLILLAILIGLFVFILGTTRYLFRLEGQSQLRDFEKVYEVKTSNPI